MPVLRNNTKKSSQRTRRRRSVRKPRHRSSVGSRIRLLLGVFAIAAAVIFVMLRRKNAEMNIPDSSPEEITYAIEQGNRAAQKFVDATNGYDKENEILAIRARETELREAGFNTAADSFVTTVDKFLRKEGVIE